MDLRTAWIVWLYSWDRRRAAWSCMQIVGSDVTFLYIKLPQWGSFRLFLRISVMRYLSDSFLHTPLPIPRNCEWHMIPISKRSAVINNDVLQLKCCLFIIFLYQSLDFPWFHLLVAPLLGIFPSIMISRIISQTPSWYSLNIPTCPILFQPYASGEMSTLVIRAWVRTSHQASIETGSTCDINTISSLNTSEMISFFGTHDVYNDATSGVPARYRLSSPRIALPILAQDRPEGWLQTSMQNVEGILSLELCP